MDAEIAEIIFWVRQTDRRFLTPSGAVDLLAMSNTLSAEDFRRYIETSRRLRAKAR